MAAKKDSVSNPLVLKVPDGWRGTVDDQNELFTHILIRYLWLRVSHTLPICGVTLEKWQKYAPKYMRMYWESLVRVYKECLDIFGKTCVYYACYEPVMAIYDWDALHTVAVMQTRFCNEPQKQAMPRGITLDYQWDVQFGVAVMRVRPQDTEIRKHVLLCMGDRYACVDELLDYVFILDDTPDNMEQIL